MKSSSRFAVAIHVLALLAVTPGPVSSAYIAGSVNTNPALIRRILVLLGQAGFTRSILGAAGGTLLARRPADINLLEVHRAVEEPGGLGMHSSIPNPDCAVGRNITSVLRSLFARAQEAMESAMESMTLKDVLDQLNARHPVR
jgi:Rrf2 family protein